MDWISVSDRPPEIGQWCLVFDKYSNEDRKKFHVGKYEGFTSFEVGLRILDALTKTPHIRRKMNIENLPKRSQYIFISLMQCCIYMREDEKDKKYFLNFCEECWDCMEMNNFEELKQAIQGKMRKDIDSFLQDNMKGKEP